MGVRWHLDAVKNKLSSPRCRRGMAWIGMQHESTRLDGGETWRRCRPDMNLETCMDVRHDQDGGESRIWGPGGR